MKFRLVTLHAIGILFTLATSINTYALDPVTSFTGSYLLGKVVDVGWDKVTGAPNVRLIDERLEAVSKPRR